MRNEETIKPAFSDNAVDLHIDIEKWLVRGFGEYSVGQMANGTLILVVEEGLSFYAYEDFSDFYSANNEFQPPNSLIRAVARALGITHVPWKDESVEIDSYFPNDEFDEQIEHGR